MGEIKKEGLGEVRNWPPIEKEDVVKLYRSLYLNPNTPSGLAKKVQFDIRVYFMRRGRENMEKMTKDSYYVASDAMGRKFVRPSAGEMTKN